MHITCLEDRPALKGGRILLTVAVSVLIASCGGGDGSSAPTAQPEMTPQQRAEAAALQKALQIAGKTNAARVRGERSEETR